MNTNQALPTRIWRMQPFSRNPLMRPVDRCESMIRLGGAALLLAVIPLAGAAGTAEYTSAADAIRVANATEVEVVATTVADPTLVTAASTYGRARYQALVQWNLEGRSDTATVPVEAETAVGSAVHVWLGPDRRPADPPRQARTAASDGIGAALGVLMFGWAGVFALVWCLEWLLGRLRSAWWEVEWRRIAKPIGT